MDGAEARTVGGCGGDRKSKPPPCVCKERRHKSGAPSGMKCEKGWVSRPLLGIWKVLLLWRIKEGCRAALCGEERTRNLRSFHTASEESCRPLPTCTLPKAWKALLLRPPASATSTVIR